jgi:3-oxoacyl-[acyl-carrier protein] reductase
LSLQESNSIGSDNVFVVIGAGGGIGSAIASRLARAGAKVMLAGRDAERLAALGGELGCRHAEVDARSEDAVLACMQEAGEWGGRLDGVVNCAGSILLKPAHLTTADEFQEVIATNLTTAFATVKSATKVMRQAGGSGGSIVLLSSAAAQIGLANHEAIAAAKAGVIGLTRSAAATYAAHGIRVNAVAPGLVDTPAAERITANATALEASRSLHPLGRIGQPDDIAGVVCWLLGEGSGWVTGQVIGVDGGLATLKARARKAAS